MATTIPIKLVYKGTIRRVRLNAPLKLDDVRDSISRTFPAVCSKNVQIRWKSTEGSRAILSQSQLAQATSDFRAVGRVLCLNLEAQTYSKTSKNAGSNEQTKATTGCSDHTDYHKSLKDDSKERQQQRMANISILRVFVIFSSICLFLLGHHVHNLHKAETSAIDFRAIPKSHDSMTKENVQRKLPPIHYRSQNKAEHNTQKIDQKYQHICNNYRTDQKNQPHQFQHGEMTQKDELRKQCQNDIPKHAQKESQGFLKNKDAQQLGNRLCNNKHTEDVNLEGKKNKHLGLHSQEIKAGLIQASRDLFQHQQEHVENYFLREQQLQDMTDSIRSIIPHSVFQMDYSPLFQHAQNLLYLTHSFDPSNLQNFPRHNEVPSKISDKREQAPTKVIKNQRHPQSNTINNEKIEVPNQNQLNLKTRVETGTDDDDLVKEVLAEVSVREKGIRDEWLTKEGIGRKEYICRKNDRKCRQHNRHARGHSNHKKSHKQKEKRNKRSSKHVSKRGHDRKQQHRGWQNGKNKWYSNKQGHQQRQDNRRRVRQPPNRKVRERQMPRKVAKALKTLHGFSNDNGISEWYVYGR